MKVELISPQGYCSGVTRAIDMALKAKKEHPDKNVYALGMLVHNQTVIDDLSKQGIITLELKNDHIPENIKEGEVVIFTAHGHSDNIEIEAKEKGLIIYDATCPIVKNNLFKIKLEDMSEHQVIYIGQKGHKETIAALSVSEGTVLYDNNDEIDFNKVIDDSPLVINQTTLNFTSLGKIHEEIKSKFPNARIENEICSATRKRQEAILNISKDTDLIIIVGDKNSSNSNKLFEIAKNNYPNSLVVMVENLSQLKEFDLSNKKKAALASGASTPYKNVEQIKEYLENYLW